MSFYPPSGKSLTSLLKPRASCSLEILVVVFLDQYCHPEVELRQNMFKIPCRGQLELLTSVGVCLVPDPGGPTPSCFSGGKNEEDYRLINTRLINDHVTPL